jgi:hypothetical protein
LLRKQSVSVRQRPSSCARVVTQFVTHKQAGRLLSDRSGRPIKSVAVLIRRHLNGQESRKVLGDGPRWLLSPGRPGQMNDGPTLVVHAEQYVIACLALGDGSKATPIELMAMTYLDGRFPFKRCHLLRAWPAPRLR